MGTLGKLIDHAAAHTAALFGPAFFHNMDVRHSFFAESSIPCASDV